MQIATPKRGHLAEAKRRRIDRPKLRRVLLGSMARDHRHLQAKVPERTAFQSPSSKTRTCTNSLGRRWMLTMQHRACQRTQARYNSAVFELSRSKFNSRRNVGAIDDVMRTQSSGMRNIYTG